MILRNRAAAHPARSTLVHAVFIVLTGLAFVRPAPLSAQSRADSAAVLLDAARRFETQGRIEVADALYAMILERYGDSAAAEEVRRLRARLPAGRLERGGAVELQVWSALYGLWLGVAFPAMFDADSPEPYGLGLLAGAPLGFLTGRSYARSRPLSEGQARAITWGGTWGTWQGFGWAQALDLGIRTEQICPSPGGPCFETETRGNQQEVFASMIAGGLIGIAVGGLLSRKPISSGVATTVNLGSLWGTWFGLATSVIADMEDDALLSGTLLGGNIGLLATAVLGPRWQLSRNRARLISIAGVVGGLAGAGLDLLIQPDDERVAMLIPLLTSTGGLAVGVATTRTYDAPGATPGNEDAAAALLRLEGGRWDVDVPTPRPTMLRTARQHGVRWQPALGVTLLAARF